MLLSQSSIISAYDELNGVEPGDVIDIALISYINGEFVMEYTNEAPLRIEVDIYAINSYFYEAILGMKIGETKPYITWMVENNTIEYYNTTILTIIYDSSYDSTLSPTDGSTSTTVNFISLILSISVVIVISKSRRNE